MPAGFITTADGTKLAGVFVGDQFYLSNLITDAQGNEIGSQILAALQALVAQGGGTVTPPTLNTLTLSQPTFAQGTAASGHFLGTTDGSTLVADATIAGFTFDNVTGSYDYDGTGTVGDHQFHITETKAGVTKISTVTLTIVAAGTFIPSLDFSDPRNSQNL